MTSIVLYHFPGACSQVTRIALDEAALDYELRLVDLGAGGTLHPIVRGILNPGRLTDGDGEPVRTKSRSLATKAYGYAESRLSLSAWWLGQRSIIDVYLAWTVSVARKGGFDFSPWPMLDGLSERLGEWPSVRRILEDDGRLLSGLESARARS